jgi:hypothetical protein
MGISADLTVLAFSWYVATIYGILVLKHGEGEWVVLKTGVDGTILKQIHLAHKHIGQPAVVSVFGIYYDNQSVIQGQSSSVQPYSLFSVLAFCLAERRIVPPSLIECDQNCDVVYCRWYGAIIQDTV